MLCTIKRNANNRCDSYNMAPTESEKEKRFVAIAGVCKHLKLTETMAERCEIAWLNKHFVGDEHNTSKNYNIIYSFLISQRVR